MKKNHMGMPKLEPREPATHKLLAEETVMPDDAPVYAEYVYIIDGVLTKNWWIHGGTVAHLKSETGAVEIRRCNLFGHPGAYLGDRVKP